MSRGGETDWAAITRAEKVRAMVAVVEQVARALGLDPYSDAEEIARRLRGLTTGVDGDWHNLQRFAGYLVVKPPSALTRAAVIERFEGRVDLAREELAS